MARKFLILLLPLVLLSACERPLGKGNAPANVLARVETLPPSLPYAPPPVAVIDNQAFSYSHSIMLETSHKNVESRFDRARDRCLHDSKLRCKLLSSQIQPMGFASAELDVALPHDMVAPFERSLSDALPNEQTSDASVVSRSTTAQNVSQDEAEANRKLTQLSDYRDRLQALAKRPGLSVDDLLKIESELSKTQSELDDALSQKNGVEDRLTREQVSISVTERFESNGPFDRLGSVWGRALELFGQSTANVLEFMIEIIPWLPLIAIMFWITRWFWRIAQRRRSVARSRPD